MPRRRPNHRLLAFIALLLALTLQTPSAQALPADFIVPMGQVTVLTIPEGAARVAIGDSSIADVIIPRGQNTNVLIVAKAAGYTNFLVWPANHAPVRNYRLEVLTFRRPEQIAIRIKVVEISHNDVNNLGVDWNGTLGGVQSSNLSKSIRFSEAPSDAPFKFGLPVRDSQLEANLDFMIQQNEAKILDQPTLITMSGQKADFLAGGEIPVPIVTQNTVDVTWKRFGVELLVTPTLEAVDTIVMQVHPEVSSLDKANGVSVNGIVVPAVDTRFADTTVEVPSGDSLVLGGLMRDELQQTVNKFPGLGDLPVLGALFRDTSESMLHSELVFIVTPTVLTGNEVLPEQNYGQGK